MEEETCFPALKLFVFLTRIREHHAATIRIFLIVSGSVCRVVDILLTTSHPSALRCSNNIRPNVILRHDVFLCSHLAVIPTTGNRTCYVGTALLRIIDCALVNTYKVSEDVEVVSVVVATVNVSLAWCQIAARTPHLCQSVVQSVLTNAVNGVPKSATLTLTFHVSKHFIEVSRSG